MLCQTLVKPVASVAPTRCASIRDGLPGGFVGIRRRNRRLYVAALTVPFVLVVIGDTRHAGLDVARRSRERRLPGELVEREADFAFLSRRSRPKFVRGRWLGWS